MAHSPGDGWEQNWRSVSSSALDAVSAAADLERLEAVRLEYLGRKGTLTLLLKGLKNLPLEGRRRFGPEANKLKNALQQALESRRAQLESAATESRRDCAGERNIAGTAQLKTKRHGAEPP